jgi:hypothetical protein
MKYVVVFVLGWSALGCVSTLHFLHRRVFPASTISFESHDKTDSHQFHSDDVMYRAVDANAFRRRRHQRSKKRREPGPPAIQSSAQGWMNGLTGVGSHMAVDAAFIALERSVDKAIVHVSRSMSLGAVTEQCAIWAVNTCIAAVRTCTHNTIDCKPSSERRRNVQHSFIKSVVRTAIRLSGAASNSVDDMVLNSAISNAIRGRYTPQELGVEIARDGARDVAIAAMSSMNIPGMFGLVWFGLILLHPEYYQ